MRDLTTIQLTNLAAQRLADQKKPVRDAITTRSVYLESQRLENWENAEFPGQYLDSLLVQPRSDSDPQVASLQGIMFLGSIHG